MEFLLPELKMIVIDYLGENKYQLNYKKVLEEYKSNYRYRLHEFFNGIKYKSMLYFTRNINNYNYCIVYNKQGMRVSYLPERYHYSNGSLNNEN